MSVYTVHQPPLRAGEAAADPERLVFVRDGFSFWAFALAPLWMLRHRLWLVFTFFIAGVAALEIALRLAGIGEPARAAIVFLLLLLVGLEASSLRRWTLGLRGWRNLGVVVGDNLESAERRFMSAFVERARAPAASPKAPPAAILRMPADTAPGIIGLFPEPGGRP